MKERIQHQIPLFQKTVMNKMKDPSLLVVMVMVFGCLALAADAQNYALDRQSTCNQYITVYDSDLTLTARSNVAPANPPLECVVYLQSAYEVADGRYRLQIIVEQLQVDDCSVKLSLFNGHGATGNYLRQLGCSSSSTDIIYTTGRQATLRFTRPQHLYQTGYAITLTVRTYASSDEIPTAVGVDKLPIGAIIGIVIGIVAVIAVAILLCWCCCTGYIHKFMEAAGFARTTVDGAGAAYKVGSVDSNLEKISTTSSTMQLRNGINYQDPAVWSSLASVNSTNRNYRQGIPRKASNRGDTSRELNTSVEMRSRAERETYRGRSYDNDGQNYNGRPYGQRGQQGRDSHVYEPYDTETAPNRSPRFLKRKDEQRGSNRSRGSRRSRTSAGGEEAGQGGAKETVIDDPGTDMTDDESSDLKKPLDSSDDEVAKLQRFESEADVDTIASPMHVNAGVRASVPDLTGQPDSPSHSPRAKKRSSTSPKSRKRPNKTGGHEPDPMGLPPEAFDPVFTTPTSQEQYPGEFRPAQPAMPPMPFMPYGMYPMVPGQQTYAYAYQTAPQMGSYPGNQGAYFMQSVPTADGDVQNTAFVMQSSRTPKRKGSKGKGGVGGMGHPGAPDFTSTPGDSPRPSHKGPASPPSDMSLIAAGAAPPDPGEGHRSVAMKSFADPDTGMQTTQVLWTDTVPDASDPKPGDSSQVTRKTTTRVTTRSGRGDLPTQNLTLLDYQDPNPAFLAPSTAHQPLHHPAAITPNTSNVDYYLGQGGSAPVRPPDVVHEAPSRNRAIRDRITFGRDSEA